jgi:hypothetical protein
LLFNLHFTIIFRAGAFVVWNLSFGEDASFVCPFLACRDREFLGTVAYVDGLPVSAPCAAALAAFRSWARPKLVSGVLTLGTVCARANVLFPSLCCWCVRCLEPLLREGTRASIFPYSLAETGNSWAQSPMLMVHPSALPARLPRQPSGLGFGPSLDQAS